MIAWVCAVWSRLCVWGGGVWLVFVVDYLFLELEMTSIDVVLVP